MKLACAKPLPRLASAPPRPQAITVPPPPPTEGPMPTPETVDDKGRQQEQWVRVAGSSDVSRKFQQAGIRSRLLSFGELPPI